MRILGIDYGEKRIGLALSDETALLAREFIVYSPKQFFENIAKIVVEKEVESVVVGLPLNMEGAHSAKTDEVVQFVDKLKSVISLPVETFDERLSTKMAHDLPGDGKNIDALAAQIILQNYLDTKRNRK